MFTYKSTASTPHRVARELGVKHVLEETVRRSGDRVRVTAQLIAAESGRHVWAERYDCSMEDLFDVEDEITEQVVTALDVALVGGEGARTLRKSLRNPQAIGLLYRGTKFIHRLTREDMAEARRCFGWSPTVRSGTPTLRGRTISTWSAAGARTRRPRSSG